MAEQIKQQFYQSYVFGPVADLVPKGGQIIIVTQTPDFGQAQIELVTDGVKTIRQLYTSWKNGEGSPFRTAAAQDAIDATAVKLTGNQTIAGVKTFTSTPVLPSSNPTTADQAVRKGYVDQQDQALGVSLTAVNTALSNRITTLENLGQFVGSFATKTAIPANKNGFANGITINDFVTVQADETKNGATTRYVAAAINASTGAVTWTYDATYSLDITGKADKVSGAVNDELAALDASGNLKKSGKKAADFTAAVAAEAQERQAGDYALQQQITALAPEGLENLPDLLASKAPINNPAFTGTPKVPSKTAAAANDGTLIATEAQVYSKADKTGVLLAHAKVSSMDLNTLRTRGFYMGTFTNLPPNMSTSYGSCLVQETDTSTAYRNQIYISEGTNKAIWYRTTNSSTAWGEWMCLATTASVASLQAETAETRIYSDSAINVFNATDATSPKSGIYTINDGSKIGRGAGWHHLIHMRHTHHNGYNSQIAVPFGSADVYVRSHNGGNWSAWERAANINSPIFTGHPCVEDVNGIVSRIAVVSNSAVSANTDLPIGSYILVQGSSTAPNIKLNTITNTSGATITLRVPTAAVFYSTQDAGTYLSGLWRSSGAGTQSNVCWYLFRRLA